MQAAGRGVRPDRPREAPPGTNLVLGSPRSSRGDIFLAVCSLKIPPPLLCSLGLSHPLAFFFGTALCSPMESSVYSPFTSSHP